MKDLLSHVLGVRVSGEVTEESMKTVLRPALDELTNRTGKLNYLLILDIGPEFHGSGLVAGHDCRAETFYRLEPHCGGDGSKAIEVFTDLLELGVPGKSKGFHLDQLAEARNWVGQTEHSTIKKIFRIPLGANLVVAGISYLTFARKAFRAQVPDWIPLSKDDTVVYSGLVEIALGSALIMPPKAGKVTAVFFAAVFQKCLAFRHFV